jgi:hypothetical protein
MPRKFASRHLGTIMQRALMFLGSSGIVNSTIVLFVELLDNIQLALLASAFDVRIRIMDIAASNVSDSATPH